MDRNREKLGEPDIAIAGLQIWVHSRQFPDEENYWDGNWLNVTVHCGAKGSSVWTSGNIIQLHDITHLSAGAKELYNYLKGKAELPCIEPELFVELEADAMGHILMTIKITPDHLSQTHKFTFDLDQSYLPQLIKGCDDLLLKFPIKGKP